MGPDGERVLTDSDVGVMKMYPGTLIVMESNYPPFLTMVVPVAAALT